MVLDGTGRFPPVQLSPPSHPPRVRHCGTWGGAVGRGGFGTVFRETGGQLAMSSRARPVAAMAGLASCRAAYRLASDSSADPPRAAQVDNLSSAMHLGFVVTGR